MEPLLHKHLGWKTLVLFVLQGCLPAIGIIIGTITLVFARPALLQGLAGTQIEKTVASLLDLTVIGGGILFLLTASIGTLIGWLKYITYRYTLGEHSFYVERGILNREEMSIPYRQIQNVDVRRAIIYRLFGVSKIIILTAGHEDDFGHEAGETEGVLPIIDKKAGETLRKEILHRTHIQEIRHTT